MSDDWWFRHTDERVAWEGQPRLSAALPGVGVGIAVCTLAAAAAVLADPRAAIGVAPGVGVMAWAILRVRRTKYLLTTRAVWLKHGIAGRTVRRVGLNKVQNTGYSRSVTGSAFGYGTVTVEVAGGDDLQFRRIDDPETVQAAITDRAGSDEDGIPGSATQWRSVLSVVREIRAGIE
ncbi:PH domain-containing protein (plasmid) [Haloarcula sp. NS06]|uniref:PH domain-containing protein n=1 Tax=Haloarcula sp. NS06 TaxID=3409688 RepID=UPI003DA764CF